MFDFRPIRLVIGLALLWASFSPQSALGWQFTEPSSGGTLDQAVAAAIRGHVFAAGSIGADLVVFKLHREHGDPVWMFRTPGGSFDFARAVAVDPTGPVIVAGRVDGQFTVIKLDGEAGTVLWSASLGGGDAFGVAVDAAGDILAGGTLLDATGVEGMGIVKLAGIDGREVWRALPRGVGGGGQVRALAIDQSGNAIVAGTMRNARTEFAVVKINGGSGGEEWRYEIPADANSRDEARAVAVDPAGDVIALGVVRVRVGDFAPSQFTVVKLATTTGSELWRRDVDSGNTSSDDAQGLAVDLVGDVVAVGSFRDFSQSAIVKLAGMDGSEQWRHVSDEPLSTRRVAVDKVGDLVAAGIGVARKVSGATGTQMWRRALDGGSNVRAVVVDPVGDAVLAGEIGADFAVVKLTGADGADF
jgi:outer membrane protein assembly factor BamB